MQLPAVFLTFCVSAAVKRGNISLLFPLSTYQILHFGKSPSFEEINFYEAISWLFPKGGFLIGV